MKLLRDFFHRRMAGTTGIAGRRQSAQGVLNVTVPAPLTKPASDLAEAFELQPQAAVRREPASFLKAARHRRLGAGH